MKNGPAHKVQDGVLKVTIWRNTSTEGKTYYTFNPTRSLQGSGDDTWKESDSLNQDDLLADGRTVPRGLHLGQEPEASRRQGREGTRQCDG